MDNAGKEGANLNAQVVTISSRVPTESYYRYDVFLSSLKRFAEVPTVLGMTDQWRGLMTKPFLLREWLRKGGNTSDRIIVADAWDVIWLQHPHGIGDRCAEMFGDAICFNCEKGMWPRADLEGAFKDRSTPWSFLNSGIFCGPADKILIALEAMKIEEVGFDIPGGPYSNDQGEWQSLYAGEKTEDNEQPVKMVVDTQCTLFQTFSACTMDEFDFNGPLIRNTITGTEPGAAHLNGGAKEIFGPAIYAKYNLP